MAAVLKDVSRILRFIIVIWNCSFLVCIHASSSRFTTLPQNQNIVEGESVDFACAASPMEESAEGNIDYSWLKNGKAIVLNKRVNQLGANLHIDDVQHDEDAGDYVCVATSVASGARQASPPARLTIIWLQSATVQLLYSNRNEVLLKCHVEGAAGDGLFELEWYRNSEKLSTWANIVLQDNRLIVRNPSEADNGLYRCLASNAAGRIMTRKGYQLQTVTNKTDSMSSTTNCLPRLKNQKLSISLMRNQIFLCRGKRGNEILKPPPGDISISEGPKPKLSVKENEAFEIPCTYNLPAQYSQRNVRLLWRKDGKVLRQTELNVKSTTSTTAEPSPVDILNPNNEPKMREDGRVILNKDNGSLIITSVLASDAGQYVCQLHIEGHTPLSSAAGDLQVVEQLKFMPHPTSKNLELGSLSKVHCKAQGTPVPQVKWLRDANPLEFPGSVDDINGTLIFKNVSADHRGNYTCVARNTQGVINATVAINVVVAPRFLVAPEGPVETVEQGTAVIHCQAKGDPKPTIQWDKDLQYLSENNTDQQRFFFLENGTLQIRNVQAEDEGRYGCTIGNSAGLKREEVHLVVKAGDGMVLADESGDGFLITRAVLITMSVALAYIVLVVGLMLWCRYRRQARKARLAELSKDNAEAGESGGKGTENEPCLPDKQNAKSNKLNGNNNPAGGDAQKSDAASACSHQSRGSKKSHVYDQLSLPRNAISELIQIGRGEFGDVFVGKVKSGVIMQTEDKDVDTEKQSNSENGSSSASTVLTTTNEKRRSKTSMDEIEEIKEEQEPGSAGDEVTTKDDYKLVLVKALNKVKDENACQEFRRQIEMLRALSHKGVARLYGLCREKDPHYMVLEYTDWGDLKQFLLATAGKANNSLTNSSSPPPLKTGQVLAVAYQIARGMDAIYRARFIHKDLATRNCVISSDFIVKVSCPALCKDKYSREYHKHRNMLLPVRWLAPECIQEDEYTTKSDIYAFAVVVWELFNQATKIPFEELSNEEFVQRAASGSLKWACAEATPESLTEILFSCWHTNPKERPSFSHICSALSKSMQNGDK